MLIFLRVLSVIALLAVAVVVATLWAKLIGIAVGDAGLTLFLLAPLPVLGLIYLLGSWIDRKLTRLAKRKAREDSLYVRW